MILIAAILLGKEIDFQKIVKESGSSDVSISNEYDDLTEGLFSETITED